MEGGPGTADELLGLAWEHCKMKLDLEGPVFHLDLIAEGGGSRWF